MACLCWDLSPMVFFLFPPLWLSPTYLLLCLLPSLTRALASNLEGFIS